MVDTVSSKVLKKLLNAGSVRKVAKILGRVNPTEIVELYAALTPFQMKTLVAAMLSDKRAANALLDLPIEVLGNVLEHVKNAQLAELIAHLEPDDAALLVNTLDDDRRRDVLGSLPSDARFEIKRLLAYPDQSAGSVMTTRYIALAADDTVARAIEVVRERSGEHESIFYLYVVDRDGRLEGVLSLRRLITAAEDARLGDLIERDLVTIGALDDQEVATNLIAKHDLLSVPVVDADKRLLGIITVDDAIDVIQEEATEDMYKMAGLSEGDRVFSPIHRSFLKRIPWTMLNLCTAFTAAWVVGLFEATIDKLVALATMMPIVAGMGGNVGSQTLIVVTRGLALNELDASSAWRAIVKQISVGLLIGLTAGLLTGVMAFLWKGNFMLGVVIFLAMAANMLIAGMMGASVPLVLRALGVDPALGSGVLVTAVTDAFGFFIFLGLASLMMKYLL
ncbi:MAG: magnesium transporter [Myxococcales bacterium]|nr:magnesium transporter [Myxococcales bacterium]